VLGLGLVVLVVTMSGCSEKTRHEWSNLAMPDPATSQGEHIFMLWRWAWVAALLTGALVWGLIFYAIWRFRRRSDDDIPVQTRYNAPLEIFYTIAPIIMVIVFFVHTERVQSEIRDDSLKPDLVVYVVGQQWTWTFNYLPGYSIPTPGDKNLYSVGEAGNPPTLVLPVDKTVEFKLHSPDVIHDFGVPAFIEKEDVIPGPASEDNHFSVTPTVIGDYRGKCYELCGVYHSRMLFNVKVVSQADYTAYLQSLQQQGNVSDQPLLGGITSQTQAVPSTSEGGE
jgi:cytochrome c oxidase subunit 2